MMNDYLSRAAVLTVEQQAEADRLYGRHVRVLRAVVIEGTGLAVVRQTAVSLPLGTRRVSHDLSIHIAQGPIEDLGPWPDLRADRRAALVAEAGLILAAMNESTDPNARERYSSGIREILAKLGRYLP